MTLNEAMLAAQFPGATGYLNSASIGLPPATAADELRAAIDQWQQGNAQAPGYDPYIDEARALFAELVNVPSDTVAISSQVSVMVGMIAAGLPSGAKVLCPDNEFTSVLFPFLARKDLQVLEVPLEQLSECIDASIDLVAFSLVQSADGQVADGERIAARARDVGALTMVDTTQAAGWLPYEAGQYDITVTGTYKWLLSPRGTAFMTVAPTAMDKPALLYPGWYAGEDIWESIYGAPLRLANSARRFDQSPAWLSWVGTALSLRLIREIGIENIQQHNVDLANACRSKLDLPASNSAIVSLNLPPGTNQEKLGMLSTANRAGRLRAGFHLYNTQRDVDLLTDALGAG